MDRSGLGLALRLLGLGWYVALCIVLGVGGGLRISSATFGGDEPMPSYTATKTELLVTYVLAAGESTRLNIGGGFGYEYAAERYPETSYNYDKTTSTFTLPAALGVEQDA